MELLKQQIEDKKLEDESLQQLKQIKATKERTQGIPVGQE
jgi:hypothetical protein